MLDYEVVHTSWIESMFCCVWDVVTQDPGNVDALPGFNCCNMQLESDQRKMTDLFTLQLLDITRGNSESYGLQPFVVWNYRVMEHSQYGGLSIGDKGLVYMTLIYNNHLLFLGDMYNHRLLLHL